MKLLPLVLFPVVAQALPLDPSEVPNREAPRPSSYADVVAGAVTAPRAAWWYAAPAAGYEPLRDRVSLYPGRMDECTVGGERVTAQPGDFYGGWITSRVTG